jgi:thiol-disulfide isomerase/thioredoxin
MRKVFYTSCFAIIILISTVYFGFVNINIGHAQKELDTEVKIIDNSVIETLKYFSLNKNDNLLNSKIIVLNFWYPYCGSCIREIPILHEIQNQFVNENINFLSYCPESLYKFNSKNKSVKDFKFDQVKFKSGVKKSISKIAANNGIKIDTSIQSFPNTFIISTIKDSILYFTQTNIKKSDLPNIYKILEKELTETK